MFLAVGETNLVERRKGRVDRGKCDADYSTRKACIATKHLLAEVFRARKLPGRLTISPTAIGQCRVRQRAVGHACRHFPHHAERIQLGLSDLHIVRPRIVRLRRRRSENDQECEALAHG